MMFSKIRPKICESKDSSFLMYKTLYYGIYNWNPKYLKIKNFCSDSGAIHYSLFDSNKKPRLKKPGFQNMVSCSYLTTETLFDKTFPFTLIFTMYIPDSRSAVETSTFCNPFTSPILSENTICP